jgi:hypothetical protein
VSLIAVRGKVEVGEQDLVCPQTGSFDRLRLFNFHNHVGHTPHLLDIICDRCARRSVMVIGSPNARTRFSF